jgi:peptide chain release factor 1
MSLHSAHLDQVLDRFDQIEARLGAAGDGAEIVALSKEHAELRPVAEAVRVLRKAEADAQELRLMILDLPAGDEMAAMAKQELAALEADLPDLQRKVQLMLLPRDKDDDASVVLEVRAGTGGEEAALFAGELFRMYQRYSSLQGWRFEVDSVSDSDLGGMKEAIASITGDGVFGRLKFESGVHRVQRVPATESGGRVHTSAATVAVLPQPEEVDIVIDEKDLRIDVFRASGPGGQSVNTTDSAVRVTHIPTGLAVAQQGEKSQHKNKAAAMKLLRTRLYDMERSKVDAARAADRKGQVGSGDRSERIRTYNFPQGRMTDHRINLTLYNLPAIVEGSALDDVVRALVAEDEAQRLATLSET